MVSRVAIKCDDCSTLIQHLVIILERASSCCCFGALIKYNLSSFSTHSNSLVCYVIHQSIHPSIHPSINALDCSIPIPIHIHYLRNEDRRKQTPRQINRQLGIPLSIASSTTKQLIIKQQTKKNHGTVAFMRVLNPEHMRHNRWTVKKRKKRQR